MKRFLLQTMVAALVVSSASPLLAADYGGLVSKSPSNAYTPVEFGSGWYLRGDIGVSFSSEADVTNSIATSSSSSDLDNGVSATLGFGQVFNDNFRVDATYDLFTGRDFSAVSANCGTGSCVDRGTFEVHNLSANAYLSLGNFGALSPYIGGGIGSAYVDLSSLTGTNETYTDSNTWNFSYALMAGLDYRIDENWTADLGYRYTNIAGSTIATGTNGNLDVDGLEFHEVRVGLRYDLW